MMIVMMIVMITSVVIGARAGATYLFQFQILLSFALTVRYRSTGGASADWCSKRCFLSFFYYLLDGSGLDRDCIVFARK